MIAVVKRVVVLLGCMCLVACGTAGSGGSAGHHTHSTGPRITRSFPAAGIQTVELRAGDANRAQVIRRESTTVITASGIPSGGVAGYHPSNNNWKETPAGRRGMGFSQRRFGSTLVISSHGETSYIHHSYELEKLVLTVPTSVRVRLVERRLSGDPKPDLAEHPAAE